MSPAKIVDIGVAQKLGDRPEQQDRYHIIRPGRFQQDYIAVFGVYDGHGGSLAVNQIEEEMLSVLESHLESNMSSCQYQDALKNALKDQDAALLATGMSHQGSTAAVALLDTARGLLVSADLGDSHIVVANKQPDEQLVWNVSRLSVLQSPSSTMERARIEDAGGEIHHSYGTARIGGLAISRALGDTNLKQPEIGEISHSLQSIRDLEGEIGVQENSIVTSDLVSNEANTTARHLKGRNVLLLASDGIGGTSDAEGAARHAAKCWEQGMSAPQTAQDLGRQAMRLPAPDNCTVVLVFIDAGSGE
ncbi:hypothetical protein KC318_g8690 [Hortaea werneckii]|uniref:protein-serine/threonine phosphatase n=1 Tax=Hortaea werneckii TaxID=91943 RepID=A0A3M6YXN6_HORWE|nr:hypothetical protein KC334_g8861 [Hortaea werneckii]KAI7012478.1 hypothetical protein KC355_g5403 [Hortaea werneckii]KAI7662764.1 hypothetical protein KC318_g8690 [Hortaea werneckii]RMY07835.1 hypothetical protein D0867_09226 [Hortaea werneckii]RMY35524.1 hypothetical protein D0866_04542 [Hortaea werneckii]